MYLSKVITIGVAVVIAATTANVTRLVIESGHETDHTQAGTNTKIIYRDYTSPPVTKTIYRATPACAQLGAISADMIRSATVVDSTTGSLSDLIDNTGAHIVSHDMQALVRDEEQASRMSDRISSPLLNISVQLREYKILKKECV